jgi:exopolysaccharide biosynthesis polyprenyl glycosylphosphotransferase
VIGIINGSKKYFYKIPILGKINDFAKIIQKMPVDEVIQTDTHLSCEKTSQINETCQLNNIIFKYVPSVFELRIKNTSLETFAGLPVIELKNTSLDGWGRIIKRLFDIIFSIILMGILSPIFIIVAAIIKLIDGGSIFYVRKRVGYLKNFKMYKFRSMKPEYCVGENYGGANAKKIETKLRMQKNERAGSPLMKIKNDPRVTKFGHFIRKTRIDELPQLFNVIKGDISIVGPRPHFPEEVNHYHKHHFKVLGIKPGITGLAQVSGSSDLDFEDEVRLDTYYIENWSLLRDLQIVLKTVLVLFNPPKTE